MRATLCCTCTQSECVLKCTHSSTPQRSPAIAQSTTTTTHQFQKSTATPPDMQPPTHQRCHGPLHQNTCNRLELSLAQAQQHPQPQRIHNTTQTPPPPEAKRTLTTTTTNSPNSNHKQQPPPSTTTTNISLPTLRTTLGSYCSDVISVPPTASKPRYTATVLSDFNPCHRVYTLFWDGLGPRHRESRSTQPASWSRVHHRQLTIYGWRLVQLGPSE